MNENKKWKILEITTWSIIILTLSSPFGFVSWTLTLSWKNTGLGTNKGHANLLYWARLRPFGILQSSKEERIKEWEIRMKEYK